MKSVGDDGRISWKAWLYYLLIKYGMFLWYKDVHVIEYGRDKPYHKFLICVVKRWK